MLGVTMTASLCGYEWDGSLGVGEWVSVCLLVCVSVCMCAEGGIEWLSPSVCQLASMGTSVSVCERVCVMSVRGECVCEVF